MNRPRIAGRFLCPDAQAAGPHSRETGVSSSPQSWMEHSACLSSGERRYITRNAVKFAAVRTANFSHPDERAGFVKAQDNQIIIITHLRPSRPPLFVPLMSQWGAALVSSDLAYLDNLPVGLLRAKSPSWSILQQMNQSSLIFLSLSPLLQAWLSHRLAKERDLYIYMCVYVKCFRDIYINTCTCMK